MKYYNIKKRKYITISVCLLLVVCCSFLKAQTPISLQAALDTALKNNLSVKNEKLKSDYQKKIIKTSASIPQANLMGEYGQINSSYSDNRLGMSQSFNFPTVYVRQKQLLNEEWKTSVLSIALKESEIKKLVRQVFYTYVFLKQKEILLLKNDSIYANFLEKANNRFSKGESNILEKTTAESQRGTMAIQLKQVQQDLEITQLQFSLLLNTSTRFTPNDASGKLSVEINLDSSVVTQHPFLKMIEQQKKISGINRKLEKSRLLPDLNIGYYNMTMRGSGADNVVYTTSARFQSVQLGVGVPLFFGAQKAKINASKITQIISENSYLQEKNFLQNQYQSVLSQYEANASAVKYYETTALKNADQLFGMGDAYQSGYRHTIQLSGCCQKFKRNNYSN
ncbi:MAG: TolC family protein [Bacteroidetes bacterium]|nr:TolC family protein [Bacteroidota bacterium]